MRRPTEGLLQRTSLFLMRTQVTALDEIAMREGSNVSQLIRDAINDLIRRKKRAEAAA